MERLIRRVTRTAQVAPAAAASVVKQNAEDVITDSLKLIAKLNRQIADAAKAIEAEESRIWGQFTVAGLTHFSDGVLEAALVDTYSNEKKEIDPETLFKLKGMKKEDFFKVVKVQIGELSKVLAENEIKAISKLTPAKKTGTELKIKPVKPVVATKPARGKK